MLSGKTTARTDTYHGRFVTLIPNERVVETYEFETVNPDLRGEMTATITLADLDGATELTAVHQGLPPGLSLADNETGWRMALDKLARLLESESSSVGPPALRIRPAIQRDLDAVRACLSAAFAPYETSYTAEAFRDTVPGSEGLAQRLRTMTILVAEDSKGDIVGTIAHEVGTGGIGHLRGMAVVPAALGSGTAGRLIEAAERALASTCSRVTLDTTQPLERAIRFYERHGYTPTGRVTDFFGMPLFEYRSVCLS